MWTEWVIPMHARADCFHSARIKNDAIVAVYQEVKPRGGLDVNTGPGMDVNPLFLVRVAAKLKDSHVLVLQNYFVILRSRGRSVQRGWPWSDSGGRRPLPSQ